MHLFYLLWILLLKNTSVKHSPQLLVPLAVTCTCKLYNSSCCDLVASLEPRFSVPDFVSQLWRKISPKLQDKIRNRKSTFYLVATTLCKQNSRRYYWSPWHCMPGVFLVWGYTWQFLMSCEHYVNNVLCMHVQWSLNRNIHEIQMYNHTSRACWTPSRKDEE